MSRALRHQLAGSNAPSSDGALWRRRRHVLRCVRLGEDSIAIAAELMIEHRLVQEIIAGEITRLYRAHFHPEAIAAELHQTLAEVRRVLKPLTKSSPRPKAAPPSQTAPATAAPPSRPFPASGGGQAPPSQPSPANGGGRSEDGARGPYGPRLTEAERDEIGRLRAQNIRFLEIAERLGRPLATVASVQHRASQADAPKPAAAGGGGDGGGVGPIEAARLTLNGRVRPGPQPGLYWVGAGSAAERLTDNRGLVRAANQILAAAGRPPIRYPGV